MKFYRDKLFDRLIMLPSVMDRYIITELIFIFLFSVGIFSSVGVAIGNISDLVNKVSEYNMPLPVAIEILLLKIPEYMAYALPISLLLATLMTYGRFSSDSELIALRGCGVSPYRIIIPAILLSCIVTSITFIFNELVVPTANYQATIIQEQYIPEDKKAFQQQDIYYPEYQLKRQLDGSQNQELKNLFYAENFDGQKMKNVTVLTWFNHQLDRTIIAKSAHWNDSQNSWQFDRGTIYKTAKNDLAGSVIRFEREQFSFSRAPLDIASKARDPYDMNLLQALEYLNILTKYHGDEKKILLFQVRIQQKIAFPFVCLVLGLIGSTLGFSPQNINKTKSFGLSVTIVFLYYFLGFLIGALGIANVLPAFLAAWLPNIFGFSIGGWLLWKTATS